MNKNPKDLAEIRRQKSLNVRIQAAEYAAGRTHPIHQNNGDEKLPRKLMSFTKGLPHDYDTGLIQDDKHFETFVEGICSGDPFKIRETPLGLPHEGTERWFSNQGKFVNKIRAWESAGAGLTFDLQGPDAQAVTMPPAPKLGSDELTAEMAEVYCQAFLRDIPFTEFKTNPQAKECLSILNKLPYFKTNKRNGKALTKDNIFRGFTDGDLNGPYISQFLLAGNNGLSTKGNKPEFKAKDGKINYGAITINQRVRLAAPRNYLTDWDEYYDVQNGANLGGCEKYVGKQRRFITTGRDLSTYVHYDALYQAYLNACLLLLGAGAPFDDGVPFQGPDDEDKQQGFAHYGGPHILTLVTEVATRALKAVRYQKFNIHRRLRPECFAARLHKMEVITELHDVPELRKTRENLEDVGIDKLLEKNNWLLPMAFYEGSPMHPTYGAGHATVAGACVTILKAFFKNDLNVNIASDGSTISFNKNKNRYAFVPSETGKTLETIKLNQPLTLEGELNKLAANISIGRDWAGVHYYSDYKESLLMGEEVAISLLQEQSKMYNPTENFSLSLRKFDGDLMKI